jgi:hypothetical protein
MDSGSAERRKDRQEPCRDPHALSKPKIVVVAGIIRNRDQAQQDGSESSHPRS